MLILERILHTEEVMSASYQNEASLSSISVEVFAAMNKVKNGN